MQRLNKTKILLMKLIFIFTMTILLVSLFPSPASVSAATLDDAAIINYFNHIEVNTAFKGLGQCYGFAKQTFADIFNLNTDDVNWDYEKGTTTSNYLYLIKKTEIENEFSALINMAKAGDVLCWGGGNGNPHSMIFIGKNDENQQITVLDNNWGENNIIKIHAIPYTQLSEIIKGGNIMSLFRYTPAQISLNSSSVTLCLGVQKELKNFQITCTAACDTYPAPIWSSSNNSIAEVDQNGKITAAGTGEAVITCRIGNKTAQCAVTVLSYQLYDSGSAYKSLSLNNFRFFELNGNADKLPALSDINLNTGIENIR